MSKIRTENGEVMVSCAKELGWEVLEIDPLEGSFGRTDDFRSLVTMRKGFLVISFLTDVFNGGYQFDIDWVSVSKGWGDGKTYQHPRYTKKYQPPVRAVVQATGDMLRKMGVGF